MPPPQWRNGYKFFIKFCMMLHLYRLEIYNYTVLLSGVLTKNVARICGAKLMAIAKLAPPIKNPVYASAPDPAEKAYSARQSGLYISTYSLKLGGLAHKDRKTNRKKTQVADKCELSNKS